jgi:flagellar biosynthesis protein FlhB
VCVCVCVFVCVCVLIILQILLSQFNFSTEWLRESLRNINAATSAAWVFVRFDRSVDVHLSSLVIQWTV